MDSDRVEIPGSELKPRNGERLLLAAAVNSQTLTVTILLRRNPKQSGPSEQELLSGSYQASGQGQAAAARVAVAADPGDVAAVRAFAGQYGLKIVDEDIASRRIRVQGTVSELEKAFGVQIGQAESASGKHYLSYTGAISVPRALGGVVTAVLGLDQRPVAAPRAQ